MRNDVIASIGQTVLTALAIKYSLSLIVLPVWCAVVELSGGRSHRETAQRLAVSMAGPITWTVIPAGVFGTLLTCAPSVIDFLLRHNDGRVIGTALGFLWWIIRPQRYQTLEVAGFYWLIEVMFPSFYKIYYFKVDFHFPNCFRTTPIVPNEAKSALGKLKPLDPSHVRSSAVRLQ